MNTRTIERRRFLKAVGLGALAGMALRALAAQGAQGDRPNILLVLTDDQGWGDITSHGNDQIDTPVMDKLAADGARFDRFYVSPVCAPTRASVLTGRYHLRTGVSGVTRAEETMRSEEVTIAEILKKAGYATGCFGKWHNGAHYPNHPNGQGFDEFLGFCAGHWNNYFDADLEHNGNPVKSKGYINDVMTDAAIAFMEKNRRRPFFCYVPYNTPHAPFQVPDKYFDICKAKGYDDALASVYSMCKNIDDNLGRMLAKLDALGVGENTIVLFFGDNGPNTDRYNGDMRGRKGSVHEGGVRNAFFMRWPKGIKPGTNIPQIASHIDLLPTLVEQTGVPMPKTLPLDGVSLAPLLKGETKNWPDRMIFSNWKARGSVRTQQYRLVVERGKHQLFDMKADPGQKTDVQGKRPEVAARLRKAYDAWYADATRNGLEPPPIPVGYREMPVVTMPAHECGMEGRVGYRGKKGWANDWVTNWKSTDDAVYWDIDVVRQGKYEITLMYTCPKSDVGAKIRVEAAGQQAEAVITEAHDPESLPTHDRVIRWEVYEKVWAPLKVGVLALPEGQTRLTVKALAIPGEHAMDLKAVQIRRT